MKGCRVDAQPACHTSQAFSGPAAAASCHLRCGSYKDSMQFIKTHAVKGSQKDVHLLLSAPPQVCVELRRMMVNNESSPRHSTVSALWASVEFDLLSLVLEALIDMFCCCCGGRSLGWMD